MSSAMPPVPTIKDVLAAATARLSAAHIESPRLNAELLLGHSIGCNRSALYARLDDELAQPVVPQFADLLDRRLTRQPLQYLVGHQEFWSLDFVVTPDVLIPRPETERIIELALSRFPQGRNGAPLKVCDIGTGSGCIAIALAHEWPAARVTAVDISTAALEVAAGNAVRCQVQSRIDLRHSDLFAALSGVYDLVVSNPPYVAARDLAAAQPELAAEPRHALHGGSDGLDVIRRLLQAAPAHLRCPGSDDAGLLLIEIGADQGDSVAALARANGAKRVRVECDYAGLPRVLCAQW